MHLDLYLGLPHRALVLATKCSYPENSAQMSVAADHRTCKCCSKPAATAQSLDEVSFLRSACTASQFGDTEKLKSLIARNSDVIHTDGTSEG